MNKKTKLISLILSPVLVLISLAIIWLQIVKPSVLEFITAQIPRVNSMQDVAHLEVGRLDLSLLKLQLIAHDTQVSFKSQTSSLQPVAVQKISAQVDIFDLIIGQISLAKIQIEGANWNYQVAPSDDSPLPEIPVEDIFKVIESIPVQRIIVENSHSNIQLAQPNGNVDIAINTLVISNRRGELDLRTENLNITFHPEDNSHSVVGTAGAALVWNKNELNVINVSAHMLNSSISASGNTKKVRTLLTAPEFQIQARSNVNLEDIRNITLTLFPQKQRVPAVSGTIQTTSSIVINSLDDITGTIQATTTQVLVDHIKLGQAQLKASLKKTHVEVSEVNLEHPSGNIILKNSRVELRNPHNFSTQIQINSFNLQKLFQSLELNDIPADFSAVGAANCKGTIRPAPNGSCSVDTSLTDMWVKPGLKEKLNIVKIKQAQLLGDIQFTDQILNYQTGIKIGSSSGKSSGTVDLKKGYDLKFETERLSFKDIESLADLKIEGDLKISGTSSGDTSYGIISAAMDMTDAAIEDFQLGHFKSELNYKSSHLTFSNASLKVGDTDLKGQLAFLFDRSMLQGNFESPNLQGRDLFYILNKKFSLPFELSGSGSAKVDISGPFDFWKLRYSLQAELKNGYVANERFDILKANLTADGRKINFDNVFLNKTKSRVTATGHIDTSGKDPRFQLQLNANPLLLEETDHVIQYAPAVSGVAYAEGNVVGTLSAPELNLDFSLRQVSYDKFDYPNSQGQVLINKDHFRFEGQFFGRQIQSNILWPWNEKNGFTAKVLIQELNPLFLLPLASIPHPTSDFNSSLSAEIDLSSRQRRLDTATGHIRINDFFLQRGSQSLKLQKPATILFKSGLSSMDNIHLKGTDAFLDLRMHHTNTNSTRLDLTADLQLRIFHFLVPFAQSLSGNLSLNSQILIRQNSFELLGDGELTDGLVAMKGFPQAIEKINTPIEFSKSKILLSDITAQLGHSDVTGVGQVDILGPKNIAVNLRAVADNVEITFPDKIFSAGKANVQLTGNWMPYTLKVDYVVSHGLVETDFEQDANQATTLRASSLLPPQSAEQSIPSLALDVSVDISRGIYIRNSLLEGEAVGQLKILGSPESPVLAGRIDIRPGSKIIFKDKYFDVQTATIQFQQTREINPDIYISANSRISEYDINLLVQGTPKNLSIKPTSQPPLSESDLFSLIALGVTSETDQNLSSSTQQTQTGLEVLAVISNQSQLNKRIQEKLGLTVQLAPSIDSTKNIAVPKVVVSKKISDKLTASYAKPFTGNDQNQEVKLQYLYNKNVSFLLNYQNKDTIQQEQVTNVPTTSKDILGLDLEYREEFK